MENSIKIIKACRTKWLSKLEGLNNAQLNHIPVGFNNNLAWQMGHIVVSQQILCYRLSGNQFVIADELIDLYKNGSKPEKDFSEEEIEQMKGYFASTIDQLELDLGNQIFENFTPYAISTYPGVELKSVQDAIDFVAAHDSLHYGCTLGLMKLAEYHIPTS
jgi:hypothetical protein